MFASSPQSTTAVPMEIIFKDELPPDCVCPVCEQVLRVPTRTVCGHHYCLQCLPQDTLSGATCIVCGSALRQEGFVQDKQKQIKIQSLMVRCQFHDNGCTWNGPLKDLKGHNAGCTFMDIHCMICGKRVSQINAEEHHKICQSTIGQCTFCEQRVKMTSMERHLKNCSKVIISCPFQCGFIDKPRHEVELHQLSCSNADKVCPFASLGCTYLGDKTGVQSHITDEPVKHLVYLCDEVTDLKISYAMLAQELGGVFDKGEELMKRTYICEEMYGSQLVWRIDNVVTKLNEAKSGARATIFSDPFVTGRHGYKMIASACLFGDGLSRGKCLSLYVTLLRGEYDSLLEWPFPMVVKMSLLDQDDVMFVRVDVDVTTNWTETPRPSAALMKASRPRSSQENKISQETPIFKKMQAPSQPRMSELEVVDVDETVPAPVAAAPIQPTVMPMQNLHTVPDVTYNTAPANNVVASSF